MGGVRRMHGRVTSFLPLVGLLTPTTLEVETFGIGEGMILDAVHIQTRFVGTFWAIEWNRWNTMTPSTDTFELLFYVNPVALLVSVIGVLSLTIPWLFLGKRIGFRGGLLIVVSIAFALVLAPGVNDLRVEQLYTYRMQPLLLPQIISLLLLLWLHRGRSQDKVK